jgi:hypothetical protein
MNTIGIILTTLGVCFSLFLRIDGDTVAGKIVTIKIPFE